MTMLLGSTYMEYATDPKRIKREAEMLRDLEFDTVVGIGMSGALALGIVALECGAPNVLVLRKDDDSSTHSNSKHEGCLGRRWLFVDDFIDKGGTFREVHRRVNGLVQDHSLETEFVGSFLYAHRYYSAEFMNPEETFSKARMESNGYTRRDYSSAHITLKRSDVQFNL